MKKNKFSINILLIVAVVVLVNIISMRLFLRLDFTEDSRYTLSKATKNILKSLDEPITITAYFSEDLPPDVAKTRRDFKELLIEYASISNGNIVYEFVNPNKDQETEMKAAQNGIQPVIINVREKDQMKQQKAYLGAVIQKGEESDIIPFMQPGAAMEYALSSSIKKLAVAEKPGIAYLQGHGEPSIASIQQAMTQLQILYDVEPVFLTDTSNNLSSYNTLVVLSPTDTVPASHLAQLDAFMARGGKLFLALNRVDGNLQTAAGSTVNTGLEKWLTNKGIIVENNFLVDASCASVGVQQQQGFFSYTTQIQFPYIPVITNFADHPAVKGLESVIMQFVSTITYTGDSTKTFIPLALSSEKSGTQTPPLYFDITKQWGQADFPLKNQTVAALVKGKISGNTESSMILVADGNFPVNGEGQQAQQQRPDNINLMVNSIDFLADETGLIDLRTKGVSSRPIDQLEDGKKATIKWVNFLLPLILILAYGIYHNQRNRRTRVKRMEEGYV